MSHLPRIAPWNVRCELQAQFTQILSLVSEARSRVFLVQVVEHATRRSRGCCVDRDIASAKEAHSRYRLTISFDGSSYELSIVTTLTIHSTGRLALPVPLAIRPRVALWTIFGNFGIAATCHSSALTGMAYLQLRSLLTSLPSAVRLLGGDFNCFPDGKWMLFLPGNGENFKPAQAAPRTTEIIDHVMVQAGTPPPRSSAPDTQKRSLAPYIWNGVYDVLTHA